MLINFFHYSPELVSVTTRFTDELMEQGLTYKVLTLVSQIDVNNEFEKLQRERGLGSEKHRKEARFHQDHFMGCQISEAEKSRQLEHLHSSSTGIAKLIMHIKVCRQLCLQNRLAVVLASF